MPSPLARSFRSLAFAAALAAPVDPARALVGAEPDSRFADRVAMVLIRGGDKAGFCSALVLSPRVLLTAAHCLRPLRDMAVHYRDAAGAAVIIPVDAAIAHPLYRADAIQGPRRIDRPCAHQDGAAASPALRRRGDRRRRPAADWRAGDRLRLWGRARGRLVVGRHAAQCHARRPRARVHCSDLGRRSRPEGRPAPAAAIPARPYGRLTDRRRLRSSPGRRRRTGAVAAA